MTRSVPNDHQCARTMWRLLASWCSYSKFLRAERRERATRTSAEPPAAFERKIRDARSVLLKGDAPGALKLYEEARAEFPDSSRTSRSGLILLLDLGRCEEAEQSMGEGRELDARNPFFLEALALISARRGNREEALQRYSLLRRKFPSTLVGYSAPAALLIEAGRLKEADDLLGNAPSDLHIKITRATIAMQRGDWAVALRRWQAISDISAHPSAPLGISQCYRQAGRFYEAEQVIVGALKYTTGNSLPFLTEMARIAESRGQWSEAAHRWMEIRMAAPRNLDAYCEGSRALLNCGQMDEAEQVLRIALERFPDSPRPWIEYARAAEQRGDMCAAAERREMVRRRFPNAAH